MLIGYDRDGFVICWAKMLEKLLSTGSIGYRCREIIMLSPLIFIYVFFYTYKRIFICFEKNKSLET